MWGDNMKKTSSVILFSLSTSLTLLSTLLFVDFVTSINLAFANGTLENNGELFGTLFLTITYSVIFLVVSVIGLIFSIISAKKAFNNIIKTISYVEIVVFSVVLVFSLYRLFLV